MVSYIKIKQYLKDTLNDIRINPKKYSTVLGGLLVLFAINTHPVGSSNAPYYLSYMQQNQKHSNNGIQARYANTIYSSNFCMVVNALTAIASGLLKNKYNFSFKQMHYVGLILYSASQFLLGFALDYSFLLFSITHTLVTGIGLGLTFIVPISLVTKWFPENKAKASSIIFVGWAIGGVAFNEFATNYINPLNEVPNYAYYVDFPNQKYFTDEALLARVPKLFFICGTICLAMNILGSILMFEKNEEPTSLTINRNEGEIISMSFEDNKMENLDQDPTKSSYPKLTLKDALKLKELYILALIFSCSSKSIQAFLGYYKAYGQTFIKDDHFLTLISVIGTVITLPGRLLWGWIFDKMSFKASYKALTICFIAITCTVFIPQYIDSFNNTKLEPMIKWIYMLYYILADLSVCGTIIAGPKVYINGFGHQNLVLIHGLIQFLGIPLTILDTLILPKLLHELDYVYTYIILNVFSAISLVALFIYSGKDHNGKDI